MRNKILLLSTLLAAASANADSVSVNGFSCYAENENPITIRTYMDHSNGDRNNVLHASNGGYRNQSDEIRLGVSLSYEFGSTTKPLDCSKLYELELKRLQLEIERMERLQGVNPVWSD